MTAAEETALLERVRTRGAITDHQRARLGHLLIRNNRFDEAVSLLASVEDAPFWAMLLLSRALLALGASGATQRAQTVLEAAIAIAPDQASLANTLASLGKCHARTGKIEAARDVLARALSCDPRNSEALKRLIALELRAGNNAVVLDIITKMARAGIVHALTLTGEMLALAAMNRDAAARAVAGLDWSLYISMPASPAGWRHDEPFNDALAAEFAAHPGRTGDRHGAASVSAWRVDDPVLMRSRATRHFTELVEGELGRYISQMRTRDHLFLRNRPAAFRLRFWSVMADGDAWEDWHMHPDGWLSGVYYPAVPVAVEDGDDAAGCLELGLSPALIGTAAAQRFGSTLLRPRKGMMALFPSHVYHRTHPHHAEGLRICVAFDVIPDDQTEQ